MHKVLPEGDNILVEILEGNEKIGSLFIPEKARDNNRDAVAAKVIAVGPGRVTEYGSRIECTQKEGDIVLVPRVNGYKIETETKAKQRIMKSCEVLAKLEESRIVTLGGLA